MDYWRQMDVFAPPEEGLPVTVIGVGGIGSPTVLALSKMGVQPITVFDDDTVETHNLPNQIYRLDDVGKPKTEALAETVAAYAGMTLNVNGRFERQPVSGVAVSAVDSMEARAAIWKRMRFNSRVLLYIDARMGAQVARIITVKPYDLDQVRWYESTLYSDEDADEARCTEKAIIYNVFLIASLIASQVKKFSSGEPIPRDIVFDFVTLTLLVS